jgi:G3E family GTPase
MMKRISVYFICGFWGSGKTTVLLRMVEQFIRENKKVGVILSDLHTINLESENGQVSVIEKCMCWSIKDDIQTTLRNMMTLNILNSIDILIVEGNGTARAQDVLEPFADSEYKEIFHLVSIIGVVDSTHILEHLSIFSSSKEVRKLLKQQIYHSSLIVLNKTDHTDHNQLRKILYKIDELKHIGTQVIMTSFGEIDLHTIQRSRITIPNKKSEIF